MGQNYNVRGGKNNRWGNKNKKGASNKTVRYEPTKLFNTIAKCTLLLALVGGIINTITPFMGEKAQVKSERVESTHQSSKTTKITVHTGKGVDINSDMLNSILDYMEDSAKDTLSNTVILDATKINDNKDYRKNVLEKLDNYKSNTLYILVNNKQLSSEETEDKISKLDQIISDNIDTLGEYNYSGVTKAVFKNETQNGDTTSFYIALLYY